MLLPVSTYERQPQGLYTLFPGDTIEGGYVGQIVASPSGNKPTVHIFNPSAADGYGSDSDLSLVGLIDDSSTGAKDSGTGNAGMFGKLVQHPFNTAGTQVGPASYFGSGKVTLWIDSGFYITDQFTGVTGSTPVGTALYASATGKLSTAVTGPIVARVIRFLAGGLSDITDVDLYGMLPRVQPKRADVSLLLLKFR